MLIYDIRHGGTISWQLAGNKSYCHGLVCHGVESKRMGDGTLLHMRVHRHYKDLLLRGGWASLTYIVQHVAVAYTIAYNMQGFLTMDPTRFHLLAGCWSRFLCQSLWQGSKMVQDAKESVKAMSMGGSSALQWAPVGSRALWLRVPWAACWGNGQRDPGEACDDGNLNATDGCSPRCEVTGAVTECHFPDLP